MQNWKLSLYFLTLVGFFCLEGSLSAQERLKKIRITYPTESIAVLPLFRCLQMEGFRG
jgi:hypothetical protein